jgi:hypothetical protein
MSAIREWLDGHHFEPDAFRCTTDDQSVTCRLEFNIESEASACAEAFGGQVSYKAKSRDLTRCNDGSLMPA